MLENREGEIGSGQFGGRSIRRSVQLVRVGDEACRGRRRHRLRSDRAVELFAPEFHFEKRDESIEAHKSARKLQSAMNIHRWIPWLFIGIVS